MSTHGGGGRSQPVGPMTRLALVIACLAPLVTLSAQQPRAVVLSQLRWLDRAGVVRGRIGPLADHGNIELAPDGSRVAVAVADRERGTRDIWMYQTGSEGRVRFTSEPADENWLIWSPDGARVALNSSSAGGVSLFETPAAGASSRTTLLANTEGIWPVSWSPDGQFILYVTNGRETSNDIWVLPLSGKRQPYPYQRSGASENWAAFSPDGRWVAFSSTAASEQPEVYVTRFPASGRTWQVSTGGGSQARWRKDGKEIFFIAADRRVMAAAVNAAGDTFEVTGMAALFTLAFPYGAYHAFDVTPDGQRFLVNTLIVGPGTPGLQARGSAF
jgi:Tol biopolymer transport system component